MSDSHELPAVESLLAERDAVLGWLTRLEQRGSSAPSEVRDRVRRDYQGRLDGLTERLREHAASIESRLRADQAEHDGLMARARTAREELAEVELRHAVGEYDAERFESERSRHVATLDTLEQSLEEVGERIGRLEGVHALVTAPAAIPDEEEVEAEPEAMPDSEPAPAAAEPKDAVETGLAAAVEEAVADPQLRDPLAPSDDEPSIIELAPADDEGEADTDTDDLLAIFSAGISLDEGDASPAEEDHAGEPEGSPPPPLTPDRGPLSFTPRGDGQGAIPSRPVSPPPPPPIGMSGADQTPRFVRPGQRGGSEVAAAPSRHHESVQVIPDPEPVLPEVPVEAMNDPAPRTLRCGECGAMNRPLEWYCEKCGAELTAV